MVVIDEATVHNCISLTADEPGKIADTNDRICIDVDGADQCNAANCPAH